MWLNKELYMFAMVISMPKENASKTTNVGLVMLNCIFRYNLAPVTFCIVPVRIQNLN